jgi:hypothetical protein
VTKAKGGAGDVRRRWGRRRLIERQINEDGDSSEVSP